MTGVEKESPDKKSEVIVVGGGPAGIAAATSASREGCDVLLLERYGHLGGLASGGLVINMVETGRYGYGICEELIENLTELNSLRRNIPGEVESEWVEGASLSGEESCFFDPEAFKLAADRLVIGSGAELLLHSYVIDAEVHEGRVQGVIIDGKSGRRYIGGDVIIDTTGDADIMAAAGVPFDYDRHPWGINLEFRIGNVDIERAKRWKKENEDQSKEVMEEVRDKGCEITLEKTANEGVVWGHGIHFHGVDGLDQKDLTEVEVKSREKIREGLNFLKANFPGFEDAFLMQTAFQPGVRETRRIKGEYTLTKNDVLKKKQFEDSIAKGPFEIPYRCLVPRKIDEILTAGRSISTTHKAHGTIRNIPPCLITGQVAGVAAAMSSEEGTNPRNLDVESLRNTLKQKGLELGF